MIKSYLIILGVTYGADFVGFAVMTHLLWPTRRQQYSLLAPKLDTSLNDEFEEFNEAPHVIDDGNDGHWSMMTRYPPVDANNHQSLDADYTVDATFNNNNVPNFENSQQNYSHGLMVDDKDVAPLIIT